MLQSVCNIFQFRSKKMITLIEFLAIAIILYHVVLMVIPICLKLCLLMAALMFHCCNPFVYLGSKGNWRKYDRRRASGNDWWSWQRQRSTNFTRRVLENNEKDFSLLIKNVFAKGELFVFQFINVVVFKELVVCMYWC